MSQQLLAGLCLRGVVVGPQLGHEVGGVLGCIHRQRLGDDEQRVGKLGDGQLLPAVQRGGVLLEVHAQGGLHRAAACKRNG